MRGSHADVDCGSPTCEHCTTTVLDACRPLAEACRDRQCLNSRPSQTRAVVALSGSELGGEPPADSTGCGPFRNEPPWCAGELTTLRALIYEALAGGDPPATRPQARFSTVKWLHPHVGLPCGLGVEDRPRLHWTNSSPAGRQAAAADPEILIAVEEEWARRELRLGVRNFAMTAFFPWMSCVRFERVQRSILLRLSIGYLVGYCCWRKNKPDNPWCIPRCTSRP